MTEVDADAVKKAALKACTDSCGTASFLEHIVHMVLPLVCQNISRGMVNDPGTCILLNEEELQPLEDGATSVPKVLEGIDLTISKINIVDAATLGADMELYPSFEWPEKDRYQQLMSQDSLTVLDIDDLTLKIKLGKGIEFAIKGAVNAMGSAVDLEVGCGGDKVGKDAYFLLEIPKTRIWIAINEQRVNFVSTKKEVYSKISVAFLGRPNLTPNVHINADRGKGDFFQTELTEKGSIDDIVERVLMGFGPTEYYEQHPEEKATPSGQKQSWIGNALGKTVSKALGKYVELGNNKPYVLDMTDSLTQSFSGKPRQVKDIQADLDRLHEELEAAKKYYDEHPEEVIAAEEEEETKE